MIGWAHGEGHGGGHGGGHGFGQGGGHGGGHGFGQGGGHGGGHGFGHGDGHPHEPLNGAANKPLSQEPIHDVDNGADKAGVGKGKDNWAISKEVFNGACSQLPVHGRVENEVVKGADNGRGNGAAKVVLNDDKPHVEHIFVDFINIFF